MRLAWAGLHRGEEPPLIGQKGSGTLFFSGCSLHCAYCQNSQISQKGAELGVIISREEFVRITLELQQMGAANINIVTGTHFIPSIAAGLKASRLAGLHIPIVWNSSGFETIEALQLIESLIDIYLIDLKTLDRFTAAQFCGTLRYVDGIKEVIKHVLFTHDTVVLEQDVMKKGVIVRHLVFPDSFAATTEVLFWFAAYAKERALLSLMVQFIASERTAFEKLTEQQYDQLIELLQQLGIEKGFVQEIGDEEPWIPDFRRENPFPSGYGVPVKLN